MRTYGFFCACALLAMAATHGQNTVFLGEAADATLLEGVPGLALVTDDLQSPKQPPELAIIQAVAQKGVTEQETAQALRARVQALHKRFPAMRMAVVSPVPYSVPQWHFPAARALHKLLEAETPNWPGTVYVDVFARMPFKNKSYDQTFYTDDGQHLGERGMEIWRDTVRPHMATTVAVAPSEVENHTVFYDPASFAAWPANGGSWVWGDEMLVCFTQAPFVNKSGHNMDLNGPQWSMCARSLDGGKTWAPEQHPELDGCSTAEAAMKRPRVRDIKPAEPEQGVDFSNPDLAVMVRGADIVVSTDRGHTWQAPIRVPSFGRPLGQWARTAYLPMGKDRCVFFMSEHAYENPGKKVERGWAYAFETRDGGKTFQILGELGKYPKELLGKDPFSLSQPAFGTMPSFVRMGDGTLVAARRSRAGERRWSDIYQSKDEGKTWELVSVAEEGGDTPPALVLLPDTQQIALVYCNRFQPYGLRGRVSDDGGKTWRNIYVLRDDGLEWDLGYNRAHLTKDGRVVTFYYYATKEKPQQHIEATIWDVRATLRREISVASEGETGK